MKKKAFISIALSGVLWGTSALFSHWLKPFGFAPVQMTAMRGTVAMVLILVFVLLTKPGLLRVPLKEIPFLLGSGINLFAAAYTYYAAMDASSVSTAVILMYTAPVFVLIYSVLFLGEKLNIIKGTSIFLMIVGCALVSGVVGGMRYSVAGILLGLASGITYSAYNIFTKILSIHKVNTLTVTTYNFIMMCVIGLAVSNPGQIVSITAQSPGSVVPLIIGIGVFTSVFPYFLYNQGLRDMPAGTASALGVIKPLSATVLSVVFLGEQLTLPLVIGMVLILVAIIALAKEKT